MSNQNGTQAVDRAARLLAEVVHSADPMTFTELSAITGLAKSTTSPSTRWPALANSSTASGLANWMPISETIRRQPRSSTATESAERISYLGIVLTNIDSHRALGCVQRERNTHLTEY